MGAGRDNKRGFVANCKTLPELGGQRILARVKIYIELQISRYLDLAPAHAELHQMGRVHIVLHQRQLDIEKHPLHPIPDVRISLERFRGEPAVDDDNLGPALVRFAQEIEPDLGFHQEDELRLEMAKGAADRKPPIEREVEDEVGFPGKDFLRQLLPGFCRG